MKKGPFLALLRTSFLRLLLTTFNVGGAGKKKKASTGIAAFIFMALLMLYLSIVTSISFAAALAPVGGLDIMLAGMALFALIFPLIFTIFSAQGLVFSPTDMDLAFSLPVSSFAIMLSRVLALYLEVLLMVELLLLPAGIVYASFGGSAAVLVGLFFGGILWAFIPTLLGLVFGCLISLLIARLKYKNLFATIFSLLLFAGVFVGMGFFFRVDVAPEAAMSLDIESIRGALFGAFPPAGWLANGSTGVPLQLLFLALVSAVPFFLVVWLFSRFYKRLLTSLSGHKLQSNYQLREVKATSSFGALLKKEFGRLFGSAAYLLNGCSGVIMMVIASGWLVFQGPALLQQMAEYGLPMELLEAYIPAVIVGICLLLGTMCFPAAVSISLEGPYLWILKEAPLSTMHIFAAKAGVNFIIAGGGMLVCTAALGIVFHVPLLTLLHCLLVGLLFAVFVSFSGVMVNLLLPRMDWTQEIVVIKQSASGIVAMLVNLALTLLIGGLFILCAVLGFDFVVFTALATVLLLGMNALLIALLRGKGQRAFYML